ncbi:MAG: diguanylate cyclase [Pseudomonadales bacterium RIFCSPLOWO2_12_59_9]|nr:MAG: diguanylate cyclase [Pseudomonadales bacterium RIFCSPLOWO2_12_59_9]
MSRIAHIGLMASYNQWMNAKLCTAASELPEAELSANRQAFFGSILGTLNHLLVADRIWLQRFACHPANYPALAPIRDLAKPTSLDQQLFSELKSLTEHRQWLDELICSWAATLVEPELDQALSYSNTEGVPANKPFFSLLMHFFNHQTHHRGQVNTLLSQAGISLGVTDLLALIPNQPET